VPLTRDAYTGIFSAILMAASFVVLTFTRIDSAWLMLGAAGAGLAANLFR
jgi:hypothetical protein